MGRRPEVQVKQGFEVLMIAPLRLTDLYRRVSNFPFNILIYAFLVMQDLALKLSG